MFFPTHQGSGLSDPDRNEVERQECIEVRYLNILYKEKRKETFVESYATYLLPNIGIGIGTEISDKN